MFFNLISSCFSISPSWRPKWYRHNYLSECANFSEKHTQKLKKVRRISKLIQRCLISVGIEWRRGKHSSTRSELQLRMEALCVWKSARWCKWCCSRTPSNTTTEELFSLKKFRRGILLKLKMTSCTDSRFWSTLGAKLLFTFSLFGTKSISFHSLNRARLRCEKVIRFGGTKHRLNSSFIRSA